MIVRLRVSPVLACRPVQGVPQLLPELSWDWLQLYHISGTLYIIHCGNSCLRQSDASKKKNTY